MKGKDTKQLPANVSTVTVYVPDGKLFSIETFNVFSVKGAVQSQAVERLTQPIQFHS